MPELVPHSTATSPPVPPLLYTALPDDPPAPEPIVAVPVMLESPAEWPGWAESSTRTEMRAAAADLRHLQGFLASVGREREASSLDAEDAYLSGIAARLARQIGHAAAGIERELAGVKP